MNTRRAKSGLERDVRAAFVELLAQMREHIPGVRVAFKDDPAASMPWHHRLAHALGRLAIPDYSRRFTTVLYPVIYLPAGTRGGYVRDPGQWYATLRHEYVHLRDIQRWPVLMPLSYLFVLPAGISARAWWELRAYTQSMVVSLELGHPLDDAYLERLVELFAGRSYLFMLWPAPLARRVLEHVRERVERGEIRGDHGAVEVWRDFLRPLLRWPLARAVGESGSRGRAASGGAALTRGAVDPVGARSI